MSTATVMARAGLGMNDLQPCGTDGARRRHLAHGQICPVCEPPTTYPRRVSCAQCGSPTGVVDGLVGPHFAQVVHGNQVVESDEPCPGEGEPVEALSPTVVALRVRRRALGLTQAQVAALTGLTRQAVTNFEAGLPMRWSGVTKIADVLGCDLVHLPVPRGAA